MESGFGLADAALLTYRNHRWKEGRGSYTLIKDGAKYCLSILSVA
jgi:hypothetical protein